MYKSTILLQLLLLGISISGAYLIYTILFDRGLLQLLQQSEEYQWTPTANSSKTMRAVNSHLKAWTTIAKHYFKIRHPIAMLTELPRVAFLWTAIATEAQRTNTPYTRICVLIFGLLQQVVGFGIALPIYLALMLPLSCEVPLQPPQYFELSQFIERLQMGGLFLSGVGLLLAAEESYSAGMMIWYIYPSALNLIHWALANPAKADLDSSLQHGSKVIYRSARSPFLNLLMISWIVHLTGLWTIFADLRNKENIKTLRILYLPFLPSLPATYGSDVAIGIEDIVSIYDYMGLVAMLIYSSHRYLRQLEIRGLKSLIPPRPSRTESIVWYLAKMTFAYLSLGPLAIPCLLLETEDRKLEFKLD